MAANPNVFNATKGGSAMKNLICARIADSLCFECNRGIGEKDFEIVFTDHYGADIITHAGDCADKHRALDKDGEPREDWGG